MASFEELIDGLPPVFRKGIAMFKLMWSGDSTRELTVKSLEADTLASTSLTSDLVTAKSIQLDTSDGPTVFPQGIFGYDAANHTATVGLENDVQLQLGMEIVRYTHNVLGAVVPDGTFVFLAPVTLDGHQSIGLVDSSLNDIHAGLTTSQFADEGHGYIVKDGVARDILITGLTIDLLVYADPLTPGGKTNTLPAWSDYIIEIGRVIKDNGDGTGDIDVSPRIVQREVPTPVVLSYSSPTPERDAEENLHGGLFSIVTGHDLSAGDLTLTGATTWGIGKMIIVVNAGSDLAGDITVTGTHVDRNTGVETPAQVSTVTIDALTVDTSGTDTNTFEFHDLQHAYITDNWFSGSADIVISQGDTILTDVDIYQCSFEQFNDAKYIELATADMNYLVVATSPMSAYIYTVEVAGDVVNLTMQGSHVQSAAEQTAGRAYRIRRGNMGIILDGTTDGIFLTIQMAGINKFRDVGIKIWGNVLYN